MLQYLPLLALAILILAGAIASLRVRAVFRMTTRRLSKDVATSTRRALKAEAELAEIRARLGHFYDLHENARNGRTPV